MTQNIAIVGTGFLGMTLAMRLADSGANVTLYESAGEIGGLASVWEINNILWDKHYHVVLASDRHTRNIIEELGLGDDFRWVETKTGFYTDGELVSMSDTLEFLKFPPLDLISKLRLGATIFYASRVKEWKRLEKITVEQWLTKLSGRKTFDKIWKPLLKAKLGEAYKETAASFIWATIQRMYSARRSGMKREMFGYVAGGYARVLERFGEVLLEKGVEIRLNSRVQQIERLENGKIKVSTAAARRGKDAKPHIARQNTKYANFQASATIAPGFSGAFLSEPKADAGSVVQFPNTANESIFDKVILTCPSNTAAKMLPQVDPAERRMLESIRYQGIVCASVMMKCSLSDFYVTNITDDTPFTGIIEMTAIVDKREFDRNALVYLPRYIAPDDDLFDRSDDEIQTLFLEGLERMYPKFKRKDVVAFKISRVRQVFPVPVLRYSEGLADKRSSVAGVYVVNSSHIVNGTLNINETVQLAETFFAEEFGSKTVI
ncbi:MAG TPA: FAD-dependent oxidoreductase [Pyrinomonadaceae bacterium]|nr:FAD-dependent oxidoreductase [Chloracidobacterium sp.]MBP9935155.1 FAD-dependent oxidoreductase [Pyrinomonadaceae bacterium]MBK7803419.1 FAD-dependent oxidoreductase [Chloracidobacterium sp.]MBK9438668.1 FAD-dependent oxidoreductase [Chloracidobacterium sp.]MBL0241194.1 FAD-dependent oxidoreductase [Chloracidobacterium sp.]